MRILILIAGAVLIALALYLGFGGQDPQAAAEKAGVAVENAAEDAATAAGEAAEATGDAAEAAGEAVKDAVEGEPAAPAAPAPANN
ncbi:hypothetical protein [Amaricoccus sp.]|uniref:hypothetical protein n=1 Tax=Amaricoccus sp. TaxID=1872485 RepID=UPI001B5C20F6|nr:hypothetical protein [Amaricoccus sp.]MBP7002662.1 hypothetical protein [Amaricoccus sp.]